MKTNSAINPIATRVAVPYYGTMLRPGSGLERVYFLADVDQKTGTFNSLGMHIWNARTFPEFSDWLSHLGVQGVICGDDHPVYEQALERVGIWVSWGRAGELEEVIEAWTRSLAA